MAGMQVNRNVFDVRTGEAIMSLRTAFCQIENVSSWLAHNPGSGATDPLVTEFKYSEDEAYLIRLVFEHFNGVRNDHSEMLVTARKLTGLE